VSEALASVHFSGARKELTAIPPAKDEVINWSVLCDSISFQRHCMDMNCERLSTVGVTNANFDCAF
jgi:hypothetical protein